MLYNLPFPYKTFFSFFFHIKLTHSEMHRFLFFPPSPSYPADPKLATLLRMAFLDLLILLLPSLQVL